MSDVATAFKGWLRGSMGHKQMVEIGFFVVWFCVLIILSVRRANGAQPTSRPPAESGRYEVVLLSFSNKISAIKSIRTIKPRLGLSEAKSIADSVPSVIDDGLSDSQAEKTRQILVAAGATVEIREMSNLPAIGQ